jgi:hypothetical protein
MQFLDIQQQPFRNPHQIWKLVPNNRLEIKKKKLRLTPSYSPERILYNQIELNLGSQQMTFVCYVKVTRKIQNISYWYVHPLRKWEKNICQAALLTWSLLYIFFVDKLPVIWFENILMNEFLLTMLPKTTKWLDRYGATVQVFSVHIVYSIWLL